MASDLRIVPTREEYLQVASGVFLRQLVFEPAVEEIPITLLFVPGWVSLPESWIEFLPFISKTFKTIYLESREKVSSRMTSQTAAIAYSVEHVANDLQEVVRVLGLRDDQFVIVGSSLGATAILEATTQGFSAKPLCFGLLVPNASFSLPWYSIPLFRMLPGALLRALKQVVKWYVLRKHVDADDPGHKRRFLASLYAADARKLRASALALVKYQLDYAVLDRIQTPCLVIGASRDKLHNQEDVRHIAKRLPRGEYWDAETFSGVHGAASADMLREYIRRIYKANQV